MAQDLPYRTSLLSLYKNVMSLHRKKLPEQLRTLADDYVRTEFKSMKAVKKSVFVEEYAFFSTFAHHAHPRLGGTSARAPILCTKLTHAIVSLDS